MLLEVSLNVRHRNHNTQTHYYYQKYYDVKVARAMVFIYTKGRRRQRNVSRKFISLWWVSPNDIARSTTDVWWDAFAAPGPMWNITSFLYTSPPHTHTHPHKCTYNYYYYLYKWPRAGGDLNTHTHAHIHLTRYPFMAQRTRTHIQIFTSSNPRHATYTNIYV